MTNIKIVTTKEYIEEHGAIPIHGQCHECNEYCNVHTDVVDILYISISKGEGYNGIVYFPRTWETTHVSNCIDHAPSEARLKEVRETIPGLSSLFFEGTSYYIIGEVPIFGKVPGMVRDLSQGSEVIRYEQPKFKCPINGTQLGKKRAVLTEVLGWKRGIIGYRRGPVKVPDTNLPDDLLQHIIKFNADYSDDVEVDSP